MNYNIGASAISQTFNAWSISKAECAPIVYKVSQESGIALPSFIIDDSAAKKISVLTTSLNDFGTYRVKVSGAPLYYDAI